MPPTRGECLTRFVAPGTEVALDVESCSCIGAPAVVLSPVPLIACRVCWDSTYLQYGTDVAFIVKITDMTDIVCCSSLQQKDVP